MSVKTVTAMLNGVQYNLALQDDGTYTAVIPAPKTTDIDLVEYRSYPVAVAVEDLAGNVAELGESLTVREEIFLQIKSWNPGDYFNIVDYNRIKYNVSYLKKIADKLFNSVEFVNMGADKDYHEHPRVQEFINIETNINHICIAAGLTKVEFQSHEEENPFLNYEGLNRIENACQALFIRLYGMMKARKTLPFKLGKRGTL